MRVSGFIATAVALGTLGIVSLVLIVQKNEPSPLDVEERVQPSVKSQPSRKTKRDLLPPSPASRAEDFPHNLKTFEDWGSITPEQMAAYRTSLIARVGRWEATEVGDFFFRTSPEISDPVALIEFRESVLGVWCAKDLRSCLDELTERGDDAAKQDALAGWASEDWLTALRYLQTTGDQTIEARLGGDSSRFAKQLISEVARANGFDEAAEVVRLFRSVKNQEAGKTALEAARQEIRSQ